MFWRLYVTVALQNSQNTHKKSNKKTHQVGAPMRAAILREVPTTTFIYLNNKTSSTSGALELCLHVELNFTPVKY